jgi:hypothetical protein
VILAKGFRGELVRAMAELAYRSREHSMNDADRFRLLGT